MLFFLSHLTKAMSIQIQSFEAELSVPELASEEGGLETFRGVFIRAPAILEVGPEVKILADIPVPSKRLSISDLSLKDQKVSNFVYCQVKISTLYIHQIKGS